jgi:hypothetical protein
MVDKIHTYYKTPKWTVQIYHIIYYIKKEKKKEKKKVFYIKFLVTLCPSAIRVSDYHGTPLPPLHPLPHG